jgi:membrane protease YdiL (CAAX protease family)
MRPLHVLVFLLPLIVAYEIGSFLFLSDPRTGKELSVSAYRLFADFFNVFGLAGASLPSITLIAVFLTWHVMVKDRWRIEPRTIGAMGLEAMVWTLPLLVLAATIGHAQRAVGGAGDGRLSMLVDAPGGGEGIRGLSVMAGLTISIGAGLYEEMLFRLVGLALLHFILADLIGLTSRWAYPIAIVIAALAFAAYHQGQSTPLFVYRTLAGVYLGTVYTMRGFGIAVGAHAIFDVMAVVALQRA